MQQEVSHHIQKYILEILLRRKVARFRDLRAPRTDTNLFSYHLKLLIKRGIIEKITGGYSLSVDGLAYVDRLSTEKYNIRSQPKIVTMTIVKNKKSEILLHKRMKQPFIDTWTLPYGKTHIDDPDIVTSARREVKEKVGLDIKKLTHVGDCYIRVKSNDTPLSTTLAHIFIGSTQQEPSIDEYYWRQVSEIDTLDLAPAVKRIVTLTESSEKHFFAEIRENLGLD